MSQLIRRSVKVSNKSALHFLACLFDVLPGERLPYICSVGSAGPAFIQRHIAGTRVRVRSLYNIIRVGKHYVMFIIGKDLYLVMF